MRRGIRPLLNLRFNKLKLDMANQQKITKEMTINEVVGQYPKAISVFMNYGLHCIGCPAASDESIEEAVKVHQGIDLDKLLQDLNKIAK